MQQFDLVVIGGGPGGYVGAIRAAQLGFSVALAEKGEVGGTCLNRGCIPTKALLHAAESYHNAKVNFAALGVHCGEVTYSAADMYARKDEVVAALRGGIEQLLAANGVVLFKGEAAILAPGQVSVRQQGGAETLQAKHILVAAGSAPAGLPVPGADLPGVFTSDDLLREAAIYPRIVIVGAGVIGVEFAAFYTSLGCEVTLLEAQPRALPFLSRELGQSVAMMLKRQGAKLHTAALLQKIEQQGKGLTCTFTEKEKSMQLEADALLVATGRKPALGGIFPGALQPETQRGCLAVDEHFQTSIPGIYAVGDIIPGPQLAHAASAQAVAAVESMAGHTSSLRLDLIPACIYTLPEIATVGLSEEEAAEKGIAVNVNKFLMGANGRTLIEDGARSYIKLICDAATGCILGAELLCHRATDIVGQLAQAIAGGLTAQQVGSVVYPHPTFCEAVGEAASMFTTGAIHAAPKAAKK